MSDLKEALFYETLTDDKVKCALCPWNCQISLNHVGICGVRQNINGKLYSLIYGKVSSIANDPIEKKPLYHFHPHSRVLSLGSVGCNMKCGHCQNWHISRAGVDSALLESLPAEQLPQLCRENNCQGIAWTYNEPIIWFEYCLDGAKIAKQNNLYTVWVTNGYINPEPLDMIAPYLDAYRVDLKGFSDQTYQKLCKIKTFQPVLDSAIRARKKWQKHVEVVTNVIPTINDDDRQLTDIAQWIAKELGPETPWHVTRFVPNLDYKHLPATPVETLEKARQIGVDAGLRFVYLGNVPGYEAGRN